MVAGDLSALSDSTLLPQQPYALSIGSSAWSALENGARGHVFAVFDHSLYLRSDLDLWACLLPATQDQGPLHVRLTNSFWGQRLASARSRWRVQSGKVLLQHCTINLAGADIWSVPSMPELTTHEIDILHRYASFLNGRSLILDGMLGRAENPLWPSRLRQAVLHLARWLHAPDLQAPTVELEILVGAGQGLTPAGDDLLAGTILAAYIARPVKAQQLRSMLLPLLSRTHPISAALLAEALAGRAAQTAHDVLKALVNGHESCVVLGQLDHFGSSSGWDLLAGMLVVLDRTWTQC